MVLTGEMLGGKSLCQCYLVHQKYLMNWPRTEIGPPRWQEGDRPPDWAMAWPTEG